MKSLKDLAEGNLKSAVALYTLFKQTSDEAYLHDVCYLSQQATEKMLKYLLEQQAIPYPRTHDIELLCELCDKHNIDFPEVIDSRALQITKWATEPRYGANFVVSKRAVEKVLEVLRVWVTAYEVQQAEVVPIHLKDKLGD